MRIARRKENLFSVLFMLEGEKKIRNLKLKKKDIIRRFLSTNALQSG